MSAIDFFKGVAQALEDRERHPYGPPAAGDLPKLAGEALVKFCDGDHDKAISLYQMIVADLSYFPHCVAFALIRAGKTENIVPAVQAPEPT